MFQGIRSGASHGRVSAALIASYILDWVIIILAAAVGGVLSLISPNKRPFSLTNTEISFPFVEHEKITTPVLFVIGLAAPAIIIVFICIIFVPGPTIPKSTPKRLIWQRKLWEWHTGWLGLALALGSSFLITQGMKNLFGKPRPDLLSRCQPNLANRSQYVIGGFADVSSEFLVYSAAICQNTDKSVLDDGFRSYPSGHASFSAAGLIYLSLFIASKFALTIPFLPPSSYSQSSTQLVAFPSRVKQNKQMDSHSRNNVLSAAPGSLQLSGHNEALVGARNQAAAPPVYLLIFAIIPWFGSIYISSTRFSDFRHHGFDILFGYAIGLICAVFAFRYYHLPVSRGAGWSWGPRSKSRSFWAGVGVGNYTGHKDERLTGEPMALNELNIESMDRRRGGSAEAGRINAAARQFASDERYQV